MKSPRSNALSESTVQVESSIDQSQVSQSLREVPQLLSAGGDLFGVEAQVVCVCHHLLEDEARLFKTAGAREAWGRVAADQEPFRLRLTQPGCFPARGAPPGENVDRRTFTRRLRRRGPRQFAAGADWRPRWARW